MGVRALTGPVSRLTTTLPANSESRMSIIALSAHLFNLRTRKVGLNQLRTVYSTVETNVQPCLS